MDKRQERIIKEMHTKWDDLREKAKVDCSGINKDNMLNDFNLANMNIKWLNLLQDWAQYFIKLEGTRKSIKRELTEYYRLHYSLKMESKEQLELFIDTDPKYEFILLKTMVVKAIMKYCEDVLEKLKSKQWEMKNFVDYQKFIHGG